MPFCDWSVHFGDGVSDSEGEALLDSLFGPIALYGSSRVTEKPVCDAF